MANQNFNCRQFECILTVFLLTTKWNKLKLSLAMYIFIGMKCNTGQECQCYKFLLILLFILILCHWYNCVMISEIYLFKFWEWTKINLPKQLLNWQPQDCGTNLAVYLIRFHFHRMFVFVLIGNHFALEWRRRNIIMNINISFNFKLLLSYILQHHCIHPYFLTSVLEGNTLPALCFAISLSPK